MGNVLDGIRVIDCSQVIQAASSACILGDLGAEVVKVEGLSGDLARNWRTVMGVSMELPGERNVVFEWANRNKRSIALDLKSDRGRRILHELVARSDVFVTNFQRETREHLGIEYETLRERNRRLIYGLATAYGKKGPSADEGAYDNVAFARSGMMYCVGEDESPPQYMAAGIVDQSSGIMMALGVIAALYDRERTGEGQEVEVSLLGSLINLIAPPMNTYLLSGRVPQRPTRTKLFSPLVGWYRCADGKWLMFSLNKPQDYWASFCEALGLGDDVSLNPRFSTIKARAANSRELIAIIDRAMLAKGRDEWLEEFRRRGMLCSPVNRIEDVVEDAQVKANEYVVKYDHPVFGETGVVSLPVRFGRHQPLAGGAAPEVGQHTEEILLELGYSWDDIGQLRDYRVIL